MIKEEENIIQIAGVLDKQDAETILNSGIKIIGFPLVLGFHKEDMNKNEVQEIIEYFGDEIEPVLITYLTKASDIINLARYINTETVQLHNYIGIDQLKMLSEESNLEIIKSIVVKDDDISQYVKEIELQEKYVDIFITDTLDHNTGAIGATGKTHNWEISKAINQATEKKLILAGGLNPANVENAILKVKPFGVDSHTGVEDKTGRKSFDKLMEFKSKAENSLKKIND
jgi:phosphoribosylanthranilate isomerase